MISTPLLLLQGKMWFLPSPVACSLMPNILGMEGPVMSASNTAVLKPRLLVAEAIMEVTRDLPTPPLPLTMPMTFFTLLNSLSCSLGISREPQSFWPQLLQSWLHSLIFSPFSRRFCAGSYMQ